MKIIVACGGRSPEREVSLASGPAVAEALRQAGFEAVLEDVKHPVDFIKKWPSLKADGVFIALHGGWGENGRFQACLEAFGIPYTGSGPEACMLAMDKTLAKLVFSARGIPVPAGIVKRRGSDCNGREKAMLQEYGRLIVKPNSGGSTVGVTNVASSAELIKGLEKAWEVEDSAVVEAYIPGCEITVAVWERESDSAEALPAIDIRPRGGFYDYQHKYTSGVTEYLCPAPLSESAAGKLARFSREAHRCLGCRAYSRADFRVTADGGIYLLEINTAPGMTETSLVPKAAAAAGISFPEFVKSVVEVSFAIDRGF